VKGIAILKSEDMDRKNTAYYCGVISASAEILRGYTDKSEKANTLIDQILKAEKSIMDNEMERLSKNKTDK